MNIVSDKISDEKDDILGRKAFATEISKALTAYATKNTDCITLSITGEWGSGKSTLLSFLKTSLASDNKQSFKIIEFNPWVFYKEGNIREAFLIHFALALKDIEAKSISLSKKIRKYITAFRFLKHVNAVAGNVQEGIEKALDYFAENDSLSELKKDIERRLLESKQKIIILIDDIDRLTQSETLELLQTISLLVNFSNVHYILAFDKSIVINAIEKEYGNRAMDYLEKVIQVDYPLPLIRKEKLESLFFQAIDEIAQEYKITFQAQTLKSFWGYHGMADYFTTLRDFKRFFNSLRFRLPLIADEINVNDFVAIEAIRLFDNEGYNQFYNYYSVNLRKRDVPEGIFKEEQLKAFRQPAADLIKALFPKSTLEAMRTDTNQKRVYDAAYFERYFSLMRNERDISENDFSEFMQRTETRASILSDALKFDRMDNLLKRLEDDAIRQHFPNYSFGVIEALLTFFNANHSEFDKRGRDVSDAIINLLCSAKRQEEFLNRFFLSFKNIKDHPSVVHIYFFHYIRMFKKDGRGFNSRFYVFDEYYKTLFEEIYSWYIGAFHTTSFSITANQFSVQCPWIKFLYLINFAELFPADYAAYQHQLLNDTDWTLYLLTQFLWVGEKLQLVRYDFRYKDLLFPDESFLAFYEKVKGLDTSELDLREKAYVQYFLRLDISKYPEIVMPD